MSYTSYTDARLFHTSSSKPRKTLRSPQRNIAFRNQYIAETKTVLVLKPFGSPHSAFAYKITEDDGTPTFTVSGRKYGDRSCREFRDASGLPLFELHRKWGWTISWSVSLPGCDTATIATGTPRVGGFGGSSGNLNLNFENAAAFEAKRVDEKMLTLRVERHGNALAAFDVVDGDRKVAEIKESIQHNEKLALISRQGWRPALDVIVMPGVDISLVATIAVIVSDWVFGSK
ncbi:hypothetical protein N7499_011494 [Penicillium canescens]|uniref:Tubby C-terminal-like domain-containing protein n=1 Tax=Penicillium canescens TaxID=5083 RepID=A0AAD6NCH2_PENCN|nr:uncharacterized protein N7446_006752 [Penicillium canescens]KAJ5990949.1 hypothetical protein N7522_011156 [Penicillium canescens]KAJ6049921.1 hypothetical protein N7444_006637 [Penicillium canescens]KAJ6052110.1 hypothetical protein N7460_002644 [Penicillium canescens]KAJ6062632.1 hypothetical protein N7446_006752 [Penicillium canescens]KAJ6069607.1 hypothetical protein N7499_011494 [Penicillium canescens]